MRKPRRVQIRGCARRVIDASGLYVMPGIVDAHNHPVYADRIETFSLSAAFGGITTVVPFIANRRREGVEGTVSDIIREFMDEAAETSYLDYAIHAILLGDDDVEDQVPEMMDMGVISFKMYMTYPRRGMMMPDDRMLKAMELAAADGGIAMVHAENGYCIDYLVDKAIEEGNTGREHYAPSQPRAHWRSRRRTARRPMRRLRVARCTSCIYRRREMIGVLERFRGSGDVQLFAETCPQYLDLTNQKMLDFGALAKIGPPLREREDNEAMWHGLVIPPYRYDCERLLRAQEVAESVIRYRDRSRAKNTRYSTRPSEATGRSRCCASPIMRA